jgi:hypothetical protein
LCSGWVAAVTIYGCFPVTYFETDAYITFLNEQNLPNLNLTVEDATRLKGASQLKFKKIKAGLFSSRQGQ